MLIEQYINSDIPQLLLKDKVKKAIQLMNDFHLVHLPIVIDKKLLGIVSEDDLMDYEQENPELEVLQELFQKGATKVGSHFLTAVQLAINNEWSIVPVIDKNENYIGVVTNNQLLDKLSKFSGADNLGGILVLSIPIINYSISEVSRLVESNNAKILHLNTEVDTVSGNIEITLHLDRKEIANLIATFQRFEYEILFANGNELLDDEIDINYKHLMNYLSI